MKRLKSQTVFYLMLKASGKKLAFGFDINGVRVVYSTLYRL